MSTVQYSTKLTKEQVKALKKISEQTHIPQAVLVRQAISILIEELRDRVASLDFLNLVKNRVKEDKELLRELIQKHYDATGSIRAHQILASWNDMIGKFVKVMPIDYKKALERMRAEEQRNTDTTPATEEVF